MVDASRTWTMIDCVLGDAIDTGLLFAMGRIKQATIEAEATWQEAVWQEPVPAWRVASKYTRADRLANKMPGMYLKSSMFSVPAIH